MNAKVNDFAAAMKTGTGRRGSIGKSAIRTLPVRVTVDMSPEVHAQAKKWTRDTASALSADVGMAEVIRLVFTTAAKDKQFSSQLRDLIAQHVAERDSK